MSTTMQRIEATVLSRQNGKELLLMADGTAEIWNVLEKCTDHVLTGGSIRHALRHDFGKGVTLAGYDYLRSLDQ